MAVLFIVINLLFALLMFFLVLSFLTGAPYVPSNNDAVESMIRLSNPKTGMTVIDLGSGDGKVLIRIGNLGVRAIGYEINPYLVILTHIRKLFSPGKRHIEVYWKNMWSADISEADVVFVYLIPWHMKRLEHKLFKEMKTGSLIVTNSFIFPGRTPEKEDLGHHVYTFRVK